MGSLFGGKPKAPPPIKPPAVMPLPDDEAIAKARKAKLAQMVQRTGRASTMLTDRETLG